jgi:hypothetical protein
MFLRWTFYQSISLFLLLFSLKQKKTCHYSIVFSLKQKKTCHYSIVFSLKQKKTCHYSIVVSMKRIASLIFRLIDKKKYHKGQLYILSCWNLKFLSTIVGMFLRWTFYQSISLFLLLNKIIRYLQEHNGKRLNPSCIRIIIGWSLILFRYFLLIRIKDGFHSDDCLSNFIL